MLIAIYSESFFAAEPVVMQYASEDYACVWAKMYPDDIVMLVEETDA